MSYQVSVSGKGAILPGVRVIINEARCRACGICHELCPAGVLGARSPLYKAEIVDIEKCTGCRVCELLCTDLAINVILPTREAVS